MSTTMTPPAPVADWIDPAELFADPYPTYERLRRESPVAWAPTLQMHVVSTYDAARRVALETENFAATIEGNIMVSTMHGPTMLTVDGEAHSSVRTPLNPGLRPKVMKERWAPAFTRNAEFYLDVLAASGPDEAELNVDFAAPLATKNLMDLLGIEGVEVPVVRHWSAQLITGLTNFAREPGLVASVAETTAEIAAHSAEIAERKRREPDGTFISTLVAAGLPQSVIDSNVMLALSGGMNEPQHAVTSMVWALTQHPDQRAAVLADASRWPDVFDETLRWISPVGINQRSAVRDIELEGVLIPAGSRIWSFLGSANRDQTRFPDADAFDIDRDKGQAMTFGGGPHMCAGMWVARWSIGNIAVPMLYRRFEGLRTAADRPAVWQGFAFRGLTSLPVTWDVDHGTDA